MSEQTIKKYLRIDKQPPSPAPELIIIEAQPVQPLDQFNHILAVAPLPIVIPQQLPRRKPPTIIIRSEGGARLSELLNIGRRYHKLCRYDFVQKVQHGYYLYERWDEWRTCALAAVYAGAFGAASIEAPGFSYSQAVWRLSQLVGYNLGERVVDGPTGRRSTVADEMIKLVDENLWSRAGVVEWLASEGM